MFKTVADRVWAFDAEWVPDPLAGRLLYDVPEEVTEPAKVLEAMWLAGGATEEDPTPFLKTVVCRVVSIAAVERRVEPDGEVVLHLMSLPRDPEDEAQAAENGVVGTFLDAVGRYRPQLVGFNSVHSDLKILLQRGVILGLREAGFCARPDKPWEGIDYFARSGEGHVDLREVLGGWGKATPSLHELAVLSGIPGKMDVDGNQVASLWLAGELKRIVDYNELDALTTYLVWLRVAHFAGHFSTAEYREEQQRVRELLLSLGEEKANLREFLSEWDRLQGLVASSGPPAEEMRLDPQGGDRSEDPEE